MQLQTGKPTDPSVPAQGLERPHATFTEINWVEINRAEVNRLLRSRLAPGPVPRSAPCLPLSGEEMQLEAAGEIDRWELIEHCYREHMARRALEELFADGEMAPFGH